MIHFVKVNIVVALAVLIGSAPSARADRPAIEQTLREIEKTVLAGDIDGYLTHVAADDPIFLKEQQNWAKDFKLHIPSAFTLSIVDPPPPAPKDPPPTAEGDAKPDDAKPKDDKPKKEDDADGVQPPVFDDAAGLATFEMKMDWTMTGIGRGGKDVTRSVSFPVRYARTRGQSVPDRWLYTGEVWATKEATPTQEVNEKDDDEPAVKVSLAPNRCRYFPGFEEVAQRIIDVLPEVRAHVDEGFENPITRVQEVKIYPSMLHLQASIYLSYVDGLSGWNEPGESIKLISRNRSGKDGLRVLLGHEYGHVATFEYGPHSSDMPWWILEGVAELSAEHFAASPSTDGKPRRRGRDAKMMVDGWAKAGELAAWDDLADFRTVKKELGGHVYKQGQHMVGYISERFGRAKRNAWLKAMAQGAKLDHATQTALGLSFADLDAAWRATLPKKVEEAEEAEVKSDEAKVESKNP